MTLLTEVTIILLLLNGLVSALYAVTTEEKGGSKKITRSLTQICVWLASTIVIVLLIALIDSANGVHLLKTMNSSGGVLLLVVVLSIVITITAQLMFQFVGKVALPSNGPGSAVTIQNSQILVGSPLHYALEANPKISIKLDTSHGIRLNSINNIVFTAELNPESVDFLYATQIDYTGLQKGQCIDYRKKLKKNFRVALFDAINNHKDDVQVLKLDGLFEKIAEDIEESLEIKFIDKSIGGEINASKNAKKKQRNS